MSQDGPLLPGRRDTSTLACPRGLHDHHDDESEPNRIINHAIASGLKADEPWLFVLGAAFILLIVVLVWTGLRRRRRSSL